MSNETALPVCTLTVNRNGIDFKLANTKLGKNHDTFPGLVFPFPEITKENLGDFINWAGDKWTISELNRSVRSDAAEIALDNTNEDGILDEAAYLKALETFTYTSGRGAGSLRAIEDDLQTLQDAQNVDVQVMLNGDDSVRDAMRDRVTSINELKAKIAERQEFYQASAAKRQATKAKKEALALAAKAATEAAKSHAGHAHANA